MRALSSVFLTTNEVKSSDSENLQGAIYLIRKWQPINYFLFTLISPLCLVNMYKKQKNFEAKIRKRLLISKHATQKSLMNDS